jgi:hypothetical protein
MAWPVTLRTPSTAMPISLFRDRFAAGLFLAHWLGRFGLLFPVQNLKPSFRGRFDIAKLF